MTGLSKVNPGDVLEIDSKTFNAFVDAANANLAGQQSRPGQLVRQPSYPCLNVSQDDAERFQPLKIVGTIIDPADNETHFNNRVGFRVEPIEAAAGIKSIVVSQAPIKAGKIGAGIVAGVTPATVDIVDDLHTHATPNNGGGFVSSDDGPALILWQDPGLGPRRAVIALIPVKLGVAKRWARITGASAAGDRRWNYGWEAVVLDMGDWSITDPPTGSLQHGKAINTLEASNSNTGMQGNGVESSNLPDGFEVVPIGAGAVVEIRGPYTRGLGLEDYWVFSAVNAVDGSCQG